MFEYKSILTVDQIPDLSNCKTDANICLKSDLDTLTEQGWEIASCVPVPAKGLYENQICWCTIVKRKKKGKKWKSDTIMKLIVTM